MSDTPVAVDPTIDLTTVDKLEEVDHLRAQLFNRDMDLLMLQQSILNSKLQEANNKLSVFSMDMVKKYGLHSPKQVDVATGNIDRSPVEEATNE